MAGPPLYLGVRDQLLTNQHHDDPLAEPSAPPITWRDPASLG